MLGPERSSLGFTREDSHEVRLSNTVTALQEVSVFTEETVRVMASAQSPPDLGVCSHSVPALRRGSARNATGQEAFGLLV